MKKNTATYAIASCFLLLAGLPSLKAEEAQSQQRVILRQEDFSGKLHLDTRTFPSPFVQTRIVVDPQQHGITITMEASEALDKSIICSKKGEQLTISLKGITSGGVSSSSSFWLSFFNLFSIINISSIRNDTIRGSATISQGDVTYTLTAPIYLTIRVDKLDSLHLLGGVALLEPLPDRQENLSLTMSHRAYLSIVALELRKLKADITHRSQLELGKAKLHTAALDIAHKSKFFSQLFVAEELSLSCQHRSSCDLPQATIKTTLQIDLGHRSHFFLVPPKST